MVYKLLWSPLRCKYGNGIRHNQENALKLWIEATQPIKWSGDIAARFQRGYTTTQQEQAGGTALASGVNLVESWEQCLWLEQKENTEK